MALLRNREVELIGRTDGQDESPNYTVMYKDGSRENVRLDQLQLTNDEMDNMKKAHGETVASNLNVIEDKDLQEIRDGQDRKKIEERQGNQPTAPIEVSKVMVDPSEVSEKTSQPVSKAKK